MKNTRLIFASLFIAGGSFMYSACQKDHMTLNSQSNNTDLKSASDEAYMDHQSTYIDGIVQTVTFDNPGIKGFLPLPPCATVTYDTTAPIKTATVDFGTSPCKTNGEEEYKEGQLIITWTGNMLDSGTIKTVTTQNYLVGDTPTAMHKLDFSKTVTNLGKNGAGNLHFGIVVSNAILSLDSGQVITWSANRDREWLQGDPQNQDDDVFIISGASSGTDRNGLPFTVQITNPLRKEVTCEWVGSGTKVVTHGTDPSRTIDYGDGSCDNIATVTVNGQTKTIHFDKDE